MGSTFQNVVGAILVALILTVGANIVGNMVIPHGERAAHREATPEGAAPGAAAPTAATAPAAPTAAAPVSLASGDAQAGQAAAKKCAACHTFNEGGANRVGPNLHGVVGAPMAGKPGFAYSEAMRAKGGSWSYEDLDQFLTKPSAFIPGTKMAFAGVADAKERADIIAYLRSISPGAPPPPAG